MSNEIEITVVTMFTKVSNYGDPIDESDYSITKRSINNIRVPLHELPELIEHLGSSMEWADYGGYETDEILYGILHFGNIEDEVITKEKVIQLADYATQDLKRAIEEEEYARYIEEVDCPDCAWVRER